ncbi:MAG: CocE/NonD family hydrolase [Chloroflexi bacterium]|nr:CocE/NonD family hydrolase [Chloroflexota bacterium]
MSVFHHAGMDALVDVKAPMRDGVHLSADIYLPRDQRGPFPTILRRTPYDNAAMGTTEDAAYFVQRGYAFVAVDCRGRFDSEGSFSPWVDEARDGHDTIEWVGGQPWCDGNVGMHGSSYMGCVQWLAASEHSEYLKCIAPRIVGTSIYDDWMFPGGAFHLSFFLHWNLRMTGRSSQNLTLYNYEELARVLPLREAPKRAGRGATHLDLLFEHPSYDSMWKSVSVNERMSQIKVPILQVNGWYDYFLGGTVRGFAGMRREGGTELARRNQKMVIGPWYHGGNLRTNAGEVDHGFGSLLDPRALELRWFDRWLKGATNGVDTEAPVRLFVMGADEWRDEQEWPLARTEYTVFSLHSRGSANSFRGDGTLSTEPPGDEPPDRYAYDPEDPVPTRGGNGFGPQLSLTFTQGGPQVFGPQYAGAYDQRPVEGRQDVLVYTTEPLTEDLEVTGPVALKLYAASDAPDTDFTAKLVDVHPSGYAVNVCDGIVRGRYRESRAEAKPITPGKVEEFTIDMWATSNLFKKGHRVRLEVSSSNFPHFDRNPNTGHDFGADAEIRVARQEVHHSRQYPSHLLLPVIPGR